MSRYELYRINDLMNKDNKQVLSIMDKNTNKVVLLVEIVNNLKPLSKMDCCFYNEVYSNSDESPFGLVYISPEFYEEYFINNPNFLEAVFMHELGHYLNKDFLKNPDLVNIERKLCLSRNVVHSTELNADQFAKKQVGKRKMIDLLDHMIKLRKNRIGDSNMTLAIKEMELRKKALK